MLPDERRELYTQTQKHFAKVLYDGIMWALEANRKAISAGLPTNEQSDDAIAEEIVTEFNKVWGLRQEGPRAALLQALLKRKG